MRGCLLDDFLHGPHHPVLLPRWLSHGDVVSTGRSRLVEKISATRPDVLGQVEWARTHSLICLERAVFSSLPREVELEVEVHGGI